MGIIVKHRRLIEFLIIVITIILLDRHYGLSEFLSDKKNWQFLQVLVKEDIYEAIFIYTLITVIACIVLALPGATFAVVAGILFGPWLGTLVCLIATTLGAIASYIAGRFFLKDSIKPLVMKNKWLRKVLFEEAGRSDVIILMITRLVPIFPYNLQNFAYGITDISIGVYAVSTFVFMLPGVAAFTIASAGIMDAANRTMYFIVSAILVVLVIILGYFIKRKYLK